MKLKVFNNESLPNNVRQGTPKIRISQRTFNINREAAELMELKLNTRVDIIQDEESPMDWYITKSEDPNAFVLASWRENEKSFLIRSTALVRKMFSALKFDSSVKSYSLPIGLDPIIHKEKRGGVELKLWPIITAAAKS